MSLDPADLRAAFGKFPTGVTVVTALSGDGTPVGFTANSFTSVSLDPPLLLVCPARSLSSYPIFAACEHFAVNVLGEDQREISNRFAGRGEDRFSATDWRADAAGVPLIGGAIAQFSCRVHQRVEAGDHLILIGRITDVQTLTGRGLGYSGEGYFSLDLERRAERLPVAGQRMLVGAILHCDGKVLLERTEQGLQLPAITIEEEHQAVRERLIDHLAARGLRVRLGPVYAAFADAPSATRQRWFLARCDSPADWTGVAVPVEALAEQRHARPGQASMLARFAEETRLGVYGLYLGTADRGDVFRPDPD